MKLPLSYSYRNLVNRRLTTLFTTAGMAMVVFVFAAILMLAEGLRKTLIDTGSDGNVVVIRKASNSEVQSGIDRAHASIIETQPEIASGPDGRPLMARELVVLINLPKRRTGRPSLVQIRGIDSNSHLLRPQVKLVSGRMPRPGSSEIIAGLNIAGRFQGGGIGEVLHFSLRDWTVVGLFDAGNTGFSSEIWGDNDQLMQAFRRPVFSSVIFRLREKAGFQTFKARIESDPRLTVDARIETKYYADQSEMMAKFLRILGMSLTVIFSLGAIIGAMITMYASVSNRTGEIGTLRSLGFHRRSILAAFMIEALLLGLTGGVIGLSFASLLQFFSVSTVNFQTFSELAFKFTLNTAITLQSLTFAVFMGLAGGLFPAIRAARMNIVEALRTG